MSHDKSSTVQHETNLKQRRCKLYLTQRELAEFSGVPLRMIQQYEQRRRNITKAQDDEVDLPFPAKTF